jgi:putative transcription factor
MGSRSSNPETLCEMCGQPTFTLIKTKIEGATLSVCRNCSQYGSTVHEKQKGTTPFTTRKAKPSQRTVAKPISTKKRRIERPQKVLKDSYVTIIRQARRKKGWSQQEFAVAIGESFSETQAIESGRLVPTDIIIAKIERELQIDLMEEIMDIEVTRTSSPFKGTTLGDIVVIKKDDKK